MKKLDTWKDLTSSAPLVLEALKRKLPGIILLAVLLTWDKFFSGPGFITVLYSALGQIIYLYLILDLSPHFTQSNLASDSHSQPALPRPQKFLIFKFALMSIIISLLTTLLALAVIVPGIWYLAKSGLADVYLTVEGCGPIESIRRSHNALTGHLWEFIVYCFPVFVAAPVSLWLLSYASEIPSFAAISPCPPNAISFTAELLDQGLLFFSSPLLLHAYQRYHNHESA